MGAFVSFLISASFLLFAGYLVFKLFLAGECTARFNRFILLTIYVLSFAICPITALYQKNNISGNFDGELIVGHILAQIDNGATNNSEAYLSALLWIYIIGVFIATTATLISYMRLIGLIHRGLRIDFGDFILVIISDHNIAPFSWQKYVVMSREDYESSGSTIICHEKAHLRAGHWIDLLLAQVVCIIEWFNPASWLMRDELRNVHEYQADRSVIESGTDVRQYQMLLIKKAVGARFQSFANSLNHSKLKKRIAMMKKSKNSPGRRWRALALAPAMVVALAVTNVPQVQASLRALSTAGLTADKVTETSAPAQDVVPQTSTQTSTNTASEPDVLPEFPGGQMAMFKYLMDNLVYPQEAVDANQEGKVAVAFTVLADGKISDVKVQKSCGEVLDREAIRVIQAMPAWTPGRSGGKVVACSMVVPVNFKLTGNKSKK